MKKVIVLFFCVACSTLLSAQKLEKFDKDRFNQLEVVPNVDELELKLDLLPIDSLPLSSGPSNDISVYVPTARMADMPVMEIDDNINYTLRIKKYNNSYPYSPVTEDSTKDQKKTWESINIFKKWDRQE